MKTLSEIKKELERQFNHRLQLRMERKLKPFCRNCRNSVEVEHDLGEFGRQTCHSCKAGCRMMEGSCDKFECRYSPDSIRQELWEDIRNPAVCGAKEPKIAALLWVLHDDGEKGVFQKIRQFFDR